MKYTRLGRSGLEVSRICLGCMGFGEPDRDRHGWTIGSDDARPIIERALDLGINFFDTANGYSDGSSEEITGAALNAMANRDEVVIATKVFFPMRGDGRNSIGLSRKAILAELDHSLRRLGTDYIDLYQIHRFDHRTPVEETMAALDHAITSGKVRYIGASSMWAWQLSKMQYTAELGGWSKFISMQDHYSLLNREEEREMIPLCADQDIGLIPWSPLARGVLARPWGTTTARSETDPYMESRVDPAYETSNRAIVEEVARIATARGVSMAQVATAWVLANPVVAAPIIGTTRLHHIEDAVAAVDFELSDDEIASLTAPYTPRPNPF